MYLSSLPASGAVDWFCILQFCVVAVCSSRRNPGYFRPSGVRWQYLAKKDIPRGGGRGRGDKVDNQRLAPPIIAAYRSLR